jgi:hypothetical protein
MQSYPAQGELALEGEIEGPLKDYKKCTIAVQSLVVKDFAAHVHFSKENAYKIKGQVRASVKADGKLVKGEVERAKITGLVDLSNAELSAGPFVKPAKSQFVLDFNMHNAQNKLQIDQLGLKSSFGVMKVSGAVEKPLDPTFALNVSMEPLNLSELRIVLPTFRELVPLGETRGKLRLQGKWIPDQPWQNEPLDVSGNLAMSLVKYEIASPTPAIDAKEKDVKNESPPPLPKAFLPRGHLTVGAQLQLALNVATFRKDTLLAKNLKVTGTYARGDFTGKASVDEVFGGKVNLLSIHVPMLTDRAVIQGEAQWTQMNLQEALAFADPGYKEFASGNTSGLVKFSTVMPGDAKFMQDLEAGGNLSFEPLVLYTVKLGEIINGLTAKIPGGKLKPVKAEPLNGKSDITFTLKQKLMQLQRFHALDKDQSEVNLQGRVNLEGLISDLNGEFFWAKPTVEGCLLQGNQDEKGRMKIPLIIKGPLTSPSYAALSGIAEKLLGKAVECEKNKFIEKAKTDGKKKLESEGKKLLKNLLK